MEQKTSDFDVEKSISAQAEYCEKTSAPHFAPKSGICWCCGKNIYALVGRKNGSMATWIGKTGRRNVPSCLIEEADYVTGISPKEASERLVTGCPHCNKSYCD